MSISDLPLSYCTNVHPGDTFDQALAALKTYTGPLAARMEKPIAAGLWMTRDAVSECSRNPELTAELSQWLRDNGLVAYTMNAFPFGNFHAERVKENVYLPDWTAATRREYTCDVAELLARLLPDDAEGSISTSPCAFKPLAPAEGWRPYFDELINTARFLADLRRSTRKMIRLAIEPEPCCVLERTDEVLDFFRELRRHVAGTSAESSVYDHLGVCFDVCHQAVEFEDVAASIAALDDANIRINKVHITCALELADPADAAAREHLARFVEPRYLHQTFGKSRSGDGTLSLVDLTREHALNPPQEWLKCSAWRVHFHVPVNERSLGPLNTTYPVLAEALAAVQRLTYDPHLEVETYTWNVLPQDEQPRVDLVSGLQAELDGAYKLLVELS